MKDEMPTAFPDDSHDFAASPCPRILWLELTSTCPFACIFCSRRLRRGAGEHLDFNLYKSIIRDLEDPEIIRLNYAGESLHYPQLVEAIKLAKETGAETELTTAFSSASGAVLRRLVGSGLDRLIISLHTLRADQFKEIYRFSCLEDMQDRIAGLVRIKEELGVRTPLLEFAFVAMKANLPELAKLSRYAREIGVAVISVFPVVQRDPIPMEFPDELEGCRLRDGFMREIHSAALLAGQAAEGIDIRICNPDPETGRQLGRLPVSFPEALPRSARIRTCPQNPWETAHILADGTIVPCEVHDREVLGNLRRQNLRAIWQGDAYRTFRRRYAAGELAACRDCPWKWAYLPAPLAPRLRAADGESAQVFRGWHDYEASGTLWSKKEAVVLLGQLPSANAVRLSGVLPPSLEGDANHLEVSCNGSVLGTIINPTNELISFHSCLGPLPECSGAFTFVLKTRTLFRPARTGLGDQRSLGFALFSIELIKTTQMRGV